MTKKGKAIILLALIMVFLCGCEMSGKQVEDSLDNIKQAAKEINGENGEEKNSEISSEANSTSEDTIGVETQVTEESEGDAAIFSEKREELGMSENELSILMQKQTSHYAYDTLSEKLKKLYAEIFVVLQAEETNVMVSAINEKEIEEAFHCVLADHPELFFVKSEVCTKYTVGTTLKRITFSGIYSCDKEERKKKQEKIDAYVDECLRGISTGASEYEKVKYVYDYLILHTMYKSNAEDQNICSVFIDHASVCQGYAKATQYLLQKLGIFSTFVEGTADGSAHAWNLVNVDNAYYYLDTTWGEGTNGKEAVQKETESVKYDYFCITTNQLCRTHQISSKIPMPRCVETKANYFVRNGAYFTSYNEEQLKKLFQKAYEGRQKYVALECSSEDVYKEINQKLIEKQKIFDYLQNTEKTVIYSKDDAQYCIQFTL